MTREEKQKTIDALKISAPVRAVTREEFNDYIQTLNQVMDWLEQEPCEDCVSRKDTLNEFKRVYFDNDTVIRCAELILGGMPSVTLQPKMGRWIDEYKNTPEAKYGRHLYVCQKCNKYADYSVGGTGDWWNIEKPNYCPNCGQPKM